MSGGRKRKPVWRLYREIPATTNPKRCKKAACKFCGKELMAQVGRMQLHTQGCLKTPAAMKRDHADMNSPAHDEGHADESVSICSWSTRQHSVSSSSSIEPKSSRQTSISSYMTSPLSIEGERQAHENLVLAFVNSNIPWNFMEDEYFIKFCKALQPELKLPSREQASGSVLCCLDAKVSAGIHKFVNYSSSLTLVTDTWTSSSNQSFSSWIIINEMGDRELLAVEPSDPTKKSEAIVTDVILKVEKLQEMRGSRNMQINFVSDSASVYVKARRLLKQDSHSGITLTGACLAHQSNLLVKDLMGIGCVWRLIEKVVTVSSFVRRSVALRNSLCEYLHVEKIPMWLPCESRWYSFSFTLKHVLNIETAIKVVFVLESSKPHLQSRNARDVRTIINNEEFWRDAKAVYQLLKPFYVITAISELDNTSAGLILMGWMWLKQEVRKSDFLTSADKATIIEKMKRRTKIFIEDHHLVGWLLDPRSRGCGVGSSGKRQVRELGKKLFYFLYPEKSDADVNHFVDQWIAYVSQTGIFNKESVIWLPCVVSKPFLFWCDVSGEAPELSQLAKAVLSCSPHTASCERLWSSAAATVTKSRNRLSQANVAMILRVKHHFMKKKASNSRAQDILGKIERFMSECKVQPGDMDLDNEEDNHHDEDNLIQNVTTVLQGLVDENERTEPQDTESYAIDLMDSSDIDCPTQILSLLRYAISK